MCEILSDYQPCGPRHPNRAQHTEQGNPLCTQCHQVIVAEDGQTCASIPLGQRWAVTYCDTEEAATMATKQHYTPSDDAATYCRHNGHYCPGCACECHAPATPEPAPEYPFCTHCKEQYDPAWAMRTVDPQLPAPYTSVACPKCAQVNRATGALIGLERPYVFCCGAPGCIVDRAAAILDGGWFCPAHAPTPDPEPQDHAARRAPDYGEALRRLNTCYAARQADGPNIRDFGGSVERFNLAVEAWGATMQAIRAAGARMMARRHAAREAAQRADEAELPCHAHLCPCGMAWECGQAHDYGYCPKCSEAVPPTSEAMAPDYWCARCDQILVDHAGDVCGVCANQPPTLAARIALARAGGLPPMAGGSEDWTCPHPPRRYYTWYAYDGTLCIGCCDCGAILRGALPPIAGGSGSRYIPDDMLFGGVAPCDHDTAGPQGACSQCELPPIAGGALDYGPPEEATMPPTHLCHVCYDLNGHPEPATQLVHYVEFDTLRAEWLCDDCAEQCVSPQAKRAALGD